MTSQQILFEKNPNDQRRNRDFQLFDEQQRLAASILLERQRQHEDQTKQIKEELIIKHHNEIQLLQQLVEEVKEDAVNAKKEVDYLKFELNNRENDIQMIKEDI